MFHDNQRDGLIFQQGQKFRTAIVDTRSNLFHDFAHLIAFGGARGKQPFRLPVQVGLMFMGRDARIDGNALRGSGNGLGVMHNDGARCRLIAGNLPRLPPAKRGAIANALLLGVL